jgi:O-methyltransferase
MYNHPMHRLLNTLNTFRYPSIIRKVRSAGLTYLDATALNDLYQAVADLETNHISGTLIEAGCALGGSAIVMASAKAKTRSFYVYDVFGMIPPPTDEDGADVHERYATISSGNATGIKGGQYYGYEKNLYDTVLQNFQMFGYPISDNATHLVQGLFEDTLHPTEPVALAHIDGDWYQSVMTCLERIVPRLVTGGRLVIDDYADWSGCRKAVDDYFASQRADFRFVQKSRLHIVRL